MASRKITGGKLPDLEVSECALPDRDVCVNTKDIKYMRDFLLLVEPTKDGGKFRNKSISDTEIVDKLKKILNVNNESEIWDNSEFKKFVGSSTAKNILIKNYKPEGPGDSTALLDNFNIDNTLSQWSLHGKELFGKKFYNIKFQMIDFAERGTELASLDIPKLINQNYDCFGVVLNTDVSTGGGKHWFCIYGDLRTNPIKLEYFNSSGNPPMSQVEVWLEKTKHELMRDHNIKADIVRSAPMRLQHSQTECGVWSLLYIKSRLDGHPTDWFYKVKADDNDMIEYRKHLFRVVN